MSTQVTNPQTRGRQQPADADPEVRKAKRQDQAPSGQSSRPAETDHVHRTGERIRNPQSEIQDAESSIENPKSAVEDSPDAGSPIQNPKSKVENGKRPYVKTPARVAAAHNNLEKARAAPKDKVYRQTEKRLAANRANLAKAKAFRQQKLEQVVDRLDQAFPTPGEPVENCPENQAADCGALEKAGRAILHRRRALLSEVRREGRQVMRLLTQAAERTVHPALQDILSLAYSLMTVLANSRLLSRAERLNKRIENLMETFVEKRYGDKMGTVVSRMAELEGMQAHIQQGLPARPKRKPRARPKPKPEEEACAGSQAPSQRPCAPVPHAGSGAGVGPNLPETLEEFQGLVRRAFYAPSADSVDDASRRMLDDLARSLWNRLHLLEEGLQREAERLDQVLDEMGDTLPENEHDLMDRCCRIAVVLKEAAADAEPMLRTCTQDLRLRLGTLMSQRYGLDQRSTGFCGTSDECRVEGEL